MPWRFIGFGAAFISALFAWDFFREEPTARIDNAMLAAAATPLTASDEEEEELPPEEPVFDAAPREEPPAEAGGE